MTQTAWHEEKVAIGTTELTVFKGGSGRPLLVCMRSWVIPAGSIGIRRSRETAPRS
jgi:hypothetical protein